MRVVSGLSMKAACCLHRNSSSSCSPSTRSPIFWPPWQAPLCRPICPCSLLRWRWRRSSISRPATAWSTGFGASSPCPQAASFSWPSRLHQDQSGQTSSEYEAPVSGPWTSCLQMRAALSGLKAGVLFHCCLLGVRLTFIFCFEKGWKSTSYLTHSSSA